MQSKTIVIAEAGVNHNGSVEIAKKLIDVASEAGADYVKFQTFKTELCISPLAKKADYQIENTGNNEESQYEMVQKLELSAEEHIELKDYCKKKNISFLSTAFDLESIDFLNELGIDFYKIPSGEITNYPYLVKIAKLNLPIVMSTGMATMEEIELALAILTENGADDNKITILHCNTEYPTSMNDVHLKAMDSIKNQFGVEVGYSDHTLGIEVPIAAVALGAKVIEKHFTLNREMEGPDHSASLEPNELKQMVSAIRNIEEALGNEIKVPTKSELKNKLLARKSIFAKTDIKKGEVYTESNLTTMRPGTGISAIQWNNIIGLEANQDYQAGEMIDNDN